MAERIRGHPWASSELGALEDWPAGLRTSVDLILRSSVPMAICWGSSAITIHNDAFGRLAGDQSDLLGSHFGSAWREIGPVLRDAMVAGLNGESLSVRHRHFAAPAIQLDERWLDFDFSPLPDDRGEAAGVVVVVVDQTERVRAELALQKLNETLEGRIAERTEALANAIDTLNGEIAERQAAEDALRQSQKMEAVGQLTGGIAHDFNNLLTGIIGSLDLMQRRIARGQTEDIQRLANTAMTSATRAATLTHRLLAFSRRQPLERKVVEIHRMTASVEDLLRRTLSERIELELVTPGGGWRTICDPNQLESAILNLAINARDAIEGRGRLRIETGEVVVDPAASKRLDVAVGDYVFIAVADTGSGMPPEVVRRAFEPFFTTKPQGVGTGLGLPMIYSFARQSGGAVEIQSELGKGTTVTVYFPRSVTDNVEVDRAPQTRSEHPDGGGRTVLVVEDEQSVRAMVMEILQDQGFRAISATDGAAGLEVLDSEAHIDLLITDVGLPVLDGRELAEAARRRRSDLKVLFMSGYPPESPLTAVHGGQPDHLIVKPFTLNALLDRIHDALSPPPPSALQAQPIRSPRIIS
jgi:signal transduction histidine kinase/ActR/RegA family two-component response regulator